MSWFECLGTTSGIACLQSNDDTSISPGNLIVIASLDHDLIRAQLGSLTHPGFCDKQKDFDGLPVMLGNTAAHGQG